MSDRNKRSRLWFEYCKAVGISPRIKPDQYILQGFETWQKMRREFSYYRYMSDNA